jgi:hypothetical protein
VAPSYDVIRSGWHRRLRSWLGGLTLTAAGWQLIMLAKTFHLTVHGDDYGQLVSFLTVVLLVGLLARLVYYRRRASPIRMSIVRNSFYYA